ncbi:MAG TPA: GNAT family N-acetyltransferase [Stellaceae bacterium]|nr:GNAT family N-acetyltransferase [Stellaceae bacterium]
MSCETSLRVVRASEADLGVWQRFVDSTPAASCMHHAGWFHILRDAYRVDPLFLLAIDDDGTVCGVLPTYFSRSFLTGPHLSTLEDGILVSSQKATQALLSEAIALRDSLGAHYLQVRGGPTSAHSQKTVCYLHTLISTARPADQLWQAVKRKTRWGIRQAEKQGVSVELDPALDRLDAFYAVYAAHMRDLGTPVMGTRTFKAMREFLGPERLRLYLLSLGHRLIGGMLCIINSDRWTDYYAVARHADEAEFANYLLYWHVIRDAAAHRVPVLDLGRSAPESNLHLFKRKWGGQDIQVPYQFYLRQGAPQRDLGLQEMKQAKSLPQQAWSHLPLIVTNHLGPLLRRQLPFI